MLKDLHIKNLILMESCHISFDEGLTILTGETGSGKSAILKGLKLVLGQKLDTSNIRRGEKKGSIQARFEIQSPYLVQLFKEHSIDLEDSCLILYREVSIEGKSRNFINDRMVPLSFLQKIGAHLIQIVDQSSQNELRTQEEQRHLLDVYASLEQDVFAFSRLFEASKTNKIKELELTNKELRKQREYDFCLEQEKELSQLRLLEKDEDLVFQEYTFLSQSQNILEKIQELERLLSEGQPNALSMTKKAKTLLQGISSHHSLLQESFSLLEQSLLSLEEALHLVGQASSLFDATPNRLDELDKKLALISQMKKKYGSSKEDWDIYYRELNEKIADFETLDEQKHKLLLEIASTEKDLSSLSAHISKTRIQASHKLSSLLSQELHDLNMPEAKVTIQITPQGRSSTGEDKVEFWIELNKGESAINLQNHSSGGELSRLLLSLKICLAEKNRIPTLIFDEIDGNVGGTTAKKIGKKLYALSSHLQVICISHFPQVASLATHHLLVQKTDIEDRTLSSVKLLNPQERQRELLRMLGESESKNALFL